MDLEKVAFLFGELPDWADPDNPDHRIVLLSKEYGEYHDEDDPTHSRVAILTGVAGQIAADNPPEVWRAARRLLAEGRDRADVMRQLVLALTPSLMRVLDEGEVFDLDAYLDALERLPVPTVAEYGQAMLDVVRDRQPIEFDTLEETVARRFGMPVDDEVLEILLDRASEELIHPDGPLQPLAGDLLLHVGSLVDGIVLTHRLTVGARSSGELPLGVDLAGFRRCIGLRLPDGGELTTVDGAWVGPPGWLADLPAGGLVAVRVTAGVPTLAPIDRDPDVADGLVDELRAVYDAQVDETSMPVTAEALLLGVLARDRAAFREPTAPLSVLLEAAGLQMRGTDVAHEQSVWDYEQLVARTERVLDELGVGPRARTALRVLDLIDEGPADLAAAREILDGLYDPAVLEILPNELLGMDDDPARLEATGALADRLLAAAGGPPQQAVAYWLAALVGERRGTLAEAESHLRAAVRADPGWSCAVDRLAWYCSDRGDAAEALALWQSLGALAAVSDDVRTGKPFPTPVDLQLGRNTPCWCGSGRTFTACHLGRRAPVLLPDRDRAGWLYRKAVAYLERRGGPPREVVTAHINARAVDPKNLDALLDAAADPLVIDAVLHESGWFDRFLADRGSLLPYAEVLMARAWTLVERTVYEVIEIHPGRGLTVRDLRTGDVLRVRVHTFGRKTRGGVPVCGRAVPDGESHQFVGGLFQVAPGTERTVLDLLDARDGPALLRHVADLHRPPRGVGPLLDVPAG